MPAVRPMFRKKFNIFTSATIPLGVFMKSSSPAADMAPMKETKKASKGYLSPRSGMSSYFGRRRWRPNTRRPSFQRFSESVPTGHNEAQKTFLISRLMSRKPMNTYMAAGMDCGRMSRGEGVIYGSSSLQWEASLQLLQDEPRRGRPHLFRKSAPTKRTEVRSRRSTPRRALAR